ncbi:MAG TPA: hypothetical protein VGP40_08505 [Chthoniobacterales bacterium]|nr:hypothetical protein [Chthoniobacterales bacterium]
MDHAWSGSEAGLATLDASAWGPQLRFSAPTRLIEKFFAETSSQLSAFVLYGSGDFHHLSALWIRRASEPLVVVSFDNHPDWDVRPPRWCCGSWVNRALELPHVQKVSVWGCGNFECWWPGQAFGNRRAERAGKLELHAWADGQSPRRQRRRGVIFAATWREEFARFVAELRGANVYITVDLDCLRSGDAVTNWENGKFSIDDVAWALGTLRGGARVIGGDICGAYSAPVYARRKQRLLSQMDHPKLPTPDQDVAREINHAALRELWPVLTD